MNHDKRVVTYDLYLAAWSNVTDNERARMLRDSLTQDVVFANPLQTRRGIEDVIAHLRGFQSRSPSGSFRMNNMLGWADHALAEWQLMQGDGTPGFSGFDALRFNEQGLISEIVLFGNSEQQKLAWRRRDAVTLRPTD